MNTRYAFHATNDALARLAVTAKSCDYVAPTVSLGATFVVCQDCIAFISDERHDESLAGIRYDLAVNVKGTSAERVPCCLCGDDSGVQS